MLAGLPKGLKKCGSKKFKNKEGIEEAPEEMSVIKMM